MKKFSEHKKPVIQIIFSGDFLGTSDQCIKIISQVQSNTLNDLTPSKISKKIEVKTQKRRDIIRKQYMEVI